MNRLDRFREDAISAARSCASMEQARQDGAVFPHVIVSVLRATGLAHTTAWPDAEDVLLKLREAAPVGSIALEFFDAAYAVMRAQGASRPGLAP